MTWFMQTNTDKDLLAAYDAFVPIFTTARPHIAHDMQANFNAYSPIIKCWLAYLLWFIPKSC